MTLYKFKKYQDKNYGTVVKFTTNYQCEVKVNPKAIMKIENMVEAKVDMVMCDDYVTDSDSAWNIATLWDKSSYVIHCVDYFSKIAPIWE